MRVTEVCSAPSPLPSPTRGEGTLARRIDQGVDFFVGLGLIVSRKTSLPSFPSLINDLLAKEMEQARWAT